VSGAFLHGYLQAAGDARFLPSDHADLRTLLDAYLLEKAIYEIGYEVNNRPDWTAIPIRGILDLLEQQR
jgi:maltose alpha-D-glucosyltransferase/alpha-amylase